MNSSTAILFFYLIGYTFGQTNYWDKAYNYAIFLSTYTDSNNISTTDLIPQKNLTKAIQVNISMVLHALFDFDEVSGTLEMSASVKLSWYDEMILVHYLTSNYSTVYVLSGIADYDFLQVQYNKMWTPKLVLANTVDQISRIGDTAYMCRYNLSDGYVTWQPKFLLKSTCSPDVTFYPFDKQDCIFTILSWGHTYKEVIFNSLYSSWDLSVYEGNGEWDIEETGSRSYISDSQSVFELSISLKRNPLYFAFNIIIPVLTLSLLNGAVFWLPVESGERVGFSITCFLTFMVLLSTILGYLPETSSTMSYLCYYVAVMLIFSGLVTGFVIFNLYIYHKDDKGNVPGFMKGFIRFWRFRWCLRLCKARTEPSDERQSCKFETPVIAIEKEKSHIADDKSEIIPSHHALMNIKAKVQKARRKSDSGNSSSRTDDVSTALDDEVTWKDFSAFLDKFLFLAFLSVEGFFSVTFLVPLAYRQ